MNTPTRFPALLTGLLSTLALVLLSSTALAYDPDINGDGCLSEEDVTCLADAALSYPEQVECLQRGWSQADLNGDRRINILDVQLLAQELWEEGPTCDCSDDPIAEDVNGDCSIDEADVACLTEAILAPRAGARSAAPACMAIFPKEADYNRDGRLDILDVVALVQALD